jgi:Uma2 family endonuclease
MTRIVDKPIRKNVPDDLQSGDRMMRNEFHRIYETMHEDFRAELVGGVVFASPPLKVEHSDHHMPVVAVLFAYEGNTPGVQTGDNATVLLSDTSEVQPDAFMRIRPEFGGQSRTSKENYVEGAPELVVEIANSTRALDLHSKQE